MKRNPLKRCQIWYNPKTFEARWISEVGVWVGGYRKGVSYNETSNYGYVVAYSEFVKWIESCNAILAGVFDMTDRGKFIPGGGKDENRKT